MGTHLEKLWRKIKMDPDFQQQAAQAKARRESMLVRIMTPEARERLATISLVNPERSRAAEDHFVQLMANGQLDAKVTDAKLVDVLENAPAPRRAKITFNRRTLDDDDW